MAAGRHGGYRDYELRDSETKESRYPKGDYRNRNGVSEHEMGVGGGRDSVGYRGRSNGKDLKGRGVINGEFRSGSSRSDSGSSGEPRRCGFVASTLDREPGELSSDGSDGAIDSETQVNYKEKEVIKIGNGARFSPVNNKKRKFSPIVWDRDDKKDIVATSRSKNTRETASLPPPHPSSIRSNQQLSNSSLTPDVNLKPSLLDDSEVRISEASPSKIDIVPDLPELPVEASSLLSLEEPMADNLETGTTYDDDYVPTRTIISSRWANDEDSPADEGEISDDENSRKLKRKSGTESAEVRGRKSITPDFAEVKRDGSDGTKGRYTGSDERLRSSSRDSSYDKNDHMEIDDERNYENASTDHSDSEYEDDHSSPEPAQPPRRSVNMLQGCRSVDEFAKLDKIDEGTYGVVYRARDKKTGEVVALKKVKMEKEREGFPMTSLREINILLSFHHPSIVDVKEVVMGDINSIFMVMEYMETDLKALMEKKKQPFSQSEVKCLMLQLLGGTKYLHDNWVLHRDLKTSNLLLNNCGELKICDFGLARQYGSPLKPYTQLVVTLWYRAPELLLGAKQYSTAIDMWSLGCIMAELLLKEPLFNGKSEIDQLDKIFRVLGTPTEAIWPGCTKLPSYKVNFVKQPYNLLRKKFPPTSFIGTPVLSDAGFDLLNKLLTYDPDKRITAGEALNHEWFREVPLPKTKELMPTFLPQHAQARRGRRVMQSPDPLEQQRKRELRQQELGGTGGLFGQ